jgi:hypothetical protein
MKAIVFCEFSQIVTKELRALGIDAYSCDILPTEGNPAWHIQDDAIKHLHDGWDLGICHPPCTDLAVSGARWFAEKISDGRQAKAIKFFRGFIELPYPHVIEQPVSIMSRLYRKPDQIIQPWQFGEPYQKTTCLWLFNLPKLIPTNIVSIHEQKCWREPPSPDRWKNRSRTYRGIAKAMANQWGEALKAKYSAQEAGK